MPYSADFDVLLTVDEAFFMTPEATDQKAIETRRPLYSQHLKGYSLLGEYGERHETPF
jgi:hypothetical protein